MNLALVIAQIKALAPYFGGRVAGAADYAAGVEGQGWLDAPAAYVVPLDGEASENASQGGAAYQVLTERINVLVQFDNRQDRRGQTVTAQYETVKYQLLAALLAWRPNSSIDNPGAVPPGGPGIDVSARGLALVGHGLVAFDLARLFYRWTFELECVVSDADGWQPPGEPLLSVSAGTADPDGGSAGVPFDVTLPQT